MSRQCEDASTRALGLADSLDQAVEERDAAGAPLASERLLREEVGRRAQDLSTALEATRQDAAAKLAEAERALVAERAARQQAKRELAQLGTEHPEPAPSS